MSSFVLDASVASAWFFADEAIGYVAAVRDSLSRDQALVPPLWPLELANALLVGERRGRLQSGEVETAFDVLSRLRIEVETQSPAHVASSIVPLARTLNLTSYDAAYLELATQRQLPLATLDKAMTAAAKRMGVQLFEPR